MKPALIFVFLLLFLPQLKASDPQLVSNFPIGGKLGEKVEVEILGKFMEDPQEILFYCDELKAEVIEIKFEVEEDKRQGWARKDGDRFSDRALLEIQIESDASLGIHYFRIVTSEGISNPLKFRVTSDTNIREVDTAHNQLLTAQPINSFPSVIQGQLPTLGEIDYYSFQASKDEFLCFQIDFMTSSTVLAMWNFRPTISLYEMRSSWFEPNRKIPLITNDPMQHRPTTAFKFPKTGKYFLEVKEISGKTGADYHTSYQLRTFHGTNPDNTECAFENDEPAHSFPLKWTWAGESAQKLIQVLSERDFTRKLKRDWIETLWSRSPLKHESQTSDQITNSPVKRFDSFVESEPNNTLDQALDVSTVPVIMEGVIDKPGDVDMFTFELSSEDSLAFEIETPLKKTPEFIPWITVLNENGKEIVQNLNKIWGRSGNFQKKYLEAKTLYDFDQAGKYFIRVRNVTSRHGDRYFKYRLLVRSQVPHVGAIRPNKDHIKLRPGQADTLSVAFELEEGFDGQVLLSVDNLPLGVTTSSAVVGKPRNTKPPEIPDLKDQRIYTPLMQKTTIVFSTNLNISPTINPQFIRLIARPMSDGKIGSPFLIGEIPLLVLGEHEDKQSYQKAGLD